MEPNPRPLTPRDPYAVASHILRPTPKSSLQPFFAPRSVAVIGATEKAGSVGRTVFWNLVSHPFGGTVLPVNPRRSSVLGVRAYPNVAALPEPVELAVIATPAPTVPGVLRDCAAAGIRAAVVLSAGFRETGPEGAALEEELRKEGARGGMRVIGPNCLGVMNPLSGLNATFAGAMARPGNVAFLSQSGALCTAVLDWSLREAVGFSAFFSLGSMADVGWSDLIDYLGDDPHTKAIVMYMESIGNARSFLSAARAVALSKPIIVLKAGRTQAAAKAAASHTGALAGSDEVLDAAFRRCGVLRVNSIAELFYMAEVLSKQPRPLGRRLAVVTNAGGPGVLATDELVIQGGELATLAPESLKALNELLPAHWSHGNPIDVLGDAEPQRYAKALEIAARDPGSDGLLVVLTPQAMTDPTGTAELLKHQAATTGKPILASWMGGTDVAAGVAILNKANIATFPYPDTAARVFTLMWRATDNLRGLCETPSLSGDQENHRPRQAEVKRCLAQAHAEGRSLLTEVESKQVLAAYDIPTVETRTAIGVEEAVQAANALGFPVVLKLLSRTITHKTDVGGVRLGLADEKAVRAAYEDIRGAVTTRVGAEHFEGVTVQPMISREGYELIVGSAVDPSFGPVLLFGSGGQLVEVYKDRALGLPPLTTTLARRMMEQTKVLTALKGVRGRAGVDLVALEHLLVRFSWLVAENPAIAEIDINPLLASPQGLVALDARVVLHPPAVAPEDLPRTAVRPYPVQYVSPWQDKQGDLLLLRPIRPEDEPALARFHGTLSEQAVYMRYFQALNMDQRTAHERLTRMCFIDYARSMALVAVRRGPIGNSRGSEAKVEEIVGVGRLTGVPGQREAEFAILVCDQEQRKGLGTELLKRLIAIGREERLTRITGAILPQNRGMQRVCEKLGFTLEDDTYEGVVNAVINLG